MLSPALRPPSREGGSALTPTSLLDKQHSGTGSSTDAGAPSDKDLDVGKRFMPEGGMRSQNVRDTTGNKPKEA